MAQQCFWELSFPMLLNIRLTFAVVQLGELQGDFLSS